MSKQFKSKAILILCSALFFSCSAISFEELECDVSILEKQSYFEDDWIKIDFSIAVDKSSVENLIQLKEDNLRIDAETMWQGSSCLLRAPGGFKKGEKYILSVSGDVYAEDGRKYETHIYREFVFGNKSQSFVLEKIEETKDLAGDVASIVFSFNKSVNPAFFEREFTISPFVEIEKKYSKDFKSVEVFPKDKWQPNQFYSWKIEKIYSADGVKIFRPYDGVFKGSKKEKAPEIIRICPVWNGVLLESQSLDDLTEKQGAAFVFDCEMDFESVQHGIYWLPTISGYWTKKDSKTFIFTPNKNYPIAYEGTVTVSDSVKDKWGVNLKQGKNFYFKQKSDWIKVKKITAAGFELKEDGENEIEFQRQSPLYVKVEFSKSISNKSISQLSGALKIEGVLPKSLANPRVESISAISDSCAAFVFSNANGIPEENQATYKIEIHGGEKFIFNEQGEYLKEDKCFYIKIKYF